MSALSSRPRPHLLVLTWSSQTPRVPFLSSSTWDQSQEDVSRPTSPLTLRSVCTSPAVPASPFSPFAPGPEPPGGPAGPAITPSEAGDEERAFVFMLQKRGKEESAEDGAKQKRREEEEPRNFMKK